MKKDESGWKCVKMDKSGWKGMKAVEMDESGWIWMNNYGGILYEYFFCNRFF